MADSDLVPFSTFVQGLPGKAPAAASEASSSANVVSAAPAKAALLAQYPWLEQHLDSQRKATTKAASKGPELPLTEEPPSLEAEVDDDAIQAVFDALHKKREEWHMGAAGEPSDFTVSLVGGAWSQKKFGKAYHAFKSAARRGDPEDWCGEYGLNKSASFEISLYGEPLAALLAQAWCHRLQYFYNIYLQCAEAGCTYSQKDVEAYEAPAEFKEAIGTLTGRQLARAAQISSIVPMRV